MTKAEEYDKAWRLGFNGDFSLVDKIYHADYSAYDYRAGVEVNPEMDKVVIATLGENVTQGKMRVIFKDSKFLCMERTFKSMQTGEPVFSIGIFTVTYLDGLIITAESAIENDAQDPSEGLNWNWKDFE